MSHPNRNFVIAYIFLVGLPLLGLAGVLRSGRGLAAPFSIDGSWKVEASASTASASSCDKFLSSLVSAPISISQSGKVLVVGVNGGKATTGGLEGKILKAQFSGADSPAAGDCSDRSLTLTAALDPEADPRTLSGTISVDGCASCAPLEFRAARQPRTTGGGAH
jgi:hypothetical protein